MKKIKVTWEVGDGYVGKSRPQSFYIDAADFDHDSPKDIEMGLCDYVDEEARNTLSFDCSNPEEVIAAIIEHQRETGTLPEAD